MNNPWGATRAKHYLGTAAVTEYILSSNKNKVASMS
jgi:hypothetical protein